MTKTYMEHAAQIQQQGYERDKYNLASDGIKPATVEAMPHYAAWMRTDLVLAVSLLSFIAEDTRTIAKYVKSVAVLLVLILLVLIFGIHR